MKVLIAGGAGFIGSKLIPKLLVLGHQITVADLFWFGDNLPAEVEKLPIHAGTITVEMLKSYSAVIFLAGLSNDPMADFSPYANFEANSAVPTYLAHTARIAGVKTFIHGGSCSVYGNVREFVTEESFPQTFSPYGVSKLMAETGILQQPGMRSVCFRMGTVCGYSPRMRFDLVLNAMTKDAILTGQINVFDSKAYRPILDIDDACDAYIKALTDDKIRGVINILTTNMTMKEAANIVQEQVARLKNHTPSIVFQNGSDIRNYRAVDRKSSQLGIAPTRRISDTVKNIIQSVDWNDDLEKSVFYNIKRLKELEEIFS